MGLYELVVEGVKPTAIAGLEEQKSYKVLYNQAVAAYIHVVNPEIIQSVLDKEDPHLMWTHLVAQCKRDTAYAPVYQVGNLCELKTSFVRRYSWERGAKSNNNDAGYRNTMRNATGVRD